MNKPSDERKLRGMICLDLDGTLLNQENEVTERNRQSMHSCLEKGLQVYLVTGRPYCFSKSLAIQIDSRIGVIASAGACYEKEGKLIEYPIADEAVGCFLDVLKEFDTAHAFLKGLRSFYTHDPYDKHFLYDHMNGWFPEELQVTSFIEQSFEEMKEKAKDIHKILVYDMDKEKLAALEERVKMIPSLCVSRYNDISFDVTAVGTSKGNAIRDIQESLGIEKSQILAIGDAPNDLPMFEAVGIRIAMANAKPEIAKYCDETTGSNCEDGVAQVLERAEQYFS